ncbi:MAG: hypothetical protein SGI72_15430 [Planctomycetota bacterium]|nr:hypothetical protein [Planctomycetota bacterium]
MNHFNLRILAQWLVLTLLVVPDANAQRQVQKLFAGNGTSADISADGA